MVTLARTASTLTIFFVGGTVYGQDDWDVLDFLPAILAGRASSIPGEAPAQGNYRALSHSIGSEVDAVAISNRGWRAVAGAVNGNIYLFSRSQTAPLFSYTTGDQIRHVDISRNGCAFVAGGLDGKIYYFECDKSTPAWTCDTGQDDTSGSSTVEGVSISQDGRWIVAVSKLDAYLFRRDKSTPVLKVRLSTYQGANDTLSTVALSADGSRFAVGTALGNTGARVYYLDQTGVIWSYFIAGVNCGINYKPTPVAISAKGELIAAGGCDGRLYVWNSTSSTPRWSHMMPNTCAPTSIAISDDGTKMAVACDNKLYFVDGTTNAPDFTNDQSDWEWDGWVSSYTQPSVYTGHDNVPGETWLGVSGSQGHVRISADGNYVSAAAYVYGYAYNFYKGINEPFRVVHLSNTSEAVGALDLSPDGSWIVFAGMGSYSGEVVRIEVAPAEFIRVEFPLTFRASNETLNELVEIVGGDKFKVDYVIVKPGRAANLTQEWAMWAAPLAGSVLIPPNQILCSGTMEWSWNHNLADGNQIVTGTRELEPPQCIQGSYLKKGPDQGFLEIKHSPLSRWPGRRANHIAGKGGASSREPLSSPPWGPVYPVAPDAGRLWGALPKCVYQPCPRLEKNSHPKIQMVEIHPISAASPVSLRPAWRLPAPLVKPLTLDWVPFLRNKLETDAVSISVLANIGVEITLTREVEDDIFYQLCLNSHELEFKQNMLIATVVGKLQHRYFPLVL